MTDNKFTDKDIVEAFYVSTDDIKKSKCVRCLKILVNGNGYGNRASHVQKSHGNFKDLLRKGRILEEPQLQVHHW